MSERIKKIIVFGATGNSGKAILQCAVSEKLEVTAYVRTPSKIPESEKDAVKIIEGDIYDKEKVMQAIKGQDAVLSALGTGTDFGETTIMSEGCKNIVSGMKKHNIKKLIVVSAGYLLPGHKAPPFLAKVTEDHVRQVEVLEAESESIDWIAIMAPRIINSNSVNPNYKVEKDCTPGVAEITSAEMADFMVKILNDEKRYKDFTHSALGMSSTVKNVI